MGKFKLSKATDEISMLVANIHTLYSGQQNYSGLSTAGAISFGVVPTQMVQSNSSLTNAYSLPVTITSGTHNFVLSYGVPNREVCFAIATIDWHGGGNSDLNKIIINDSYEFASFPITLDSANTACSSISEGSQTATVKMDFK